MLPHLQFERENSQCVENKEFFSKIDATSIVKIAIIAVAMPCIFSEIQAQNIRKPPVNLSLTEPWGIKPGIIKKRCNLPSLRYLLAR